MHGDIEIVAGNGHRELASKIAHYFGKSLLNITVDKFCDSETNIELHENVRGKDVFIIQPTGFQINDRYMELFILADALKRASAERITAVIPYLGYSRQERRHNHSAIAARLIADLIEKSGINRVLSLELHTDAIEGFFHIPIDHLHIHHFFVEKIKELEIINPVIVSPDIGGTIRARSLSKLLGCDFAVLDKERENGGEARIFNLIGSVKGKTVILFDDICDSGGSLKNAASKVFEEGATQIIALVCHGIFSGSALHLIDESYIQKFLVTNSLPFMGSLKEHPKIKVLDVSGFLATAIRRIHTSDSSSEIFHP